MKETPILVAAAWPYANAEIHVGNLTGSYLPADIFARYQRLRGRKVLMVSGSDSHGTPITIRADAEGTTPYEAYQRFHNSFIDLFQKLGTHLRSLHQHPYRPITLTSRKRSSWHSRTTGSFIPTRPSSGTLPARSASFPTVTWKAPVISAAIPTPARTSATNAAACWMPIS